MKKPFLILVFALAALVLSACTGNPAGNNWPGLAADAQYAYLAAGSHVYVVELESGREAWRYPQEADNKLLYYSNPVLTGDGQILVGSSGQTHALTSIDPETRDENWSFTEAKGAWIAPPLVFEGTIFAPNTDGFVYILDLNGRPAADPIEMGGALWAAPVTDGTRIYVTSLDHHLHIIDPQRLAAGKPIDLGGAVPGSPAPAGDGVYAGSFASKIEFIAADGKHETIADADNWIWGSPTLDGDTLFYADLDGGIFSLDLPSGRQNWGEIKPDGPIVAKLLVLDGSIFAATESGTLVALDRESALLWEKAVGGKIYTSPVAAGDLILVAPYQADFLLAAYDAQGKQAWTFALQD